MNVKLSSRVARVMLYQPIVDMPDATKRAFADAVNSAEAFEELRPEYKLLIHAAELVARCR